MIRSHSIPTFAFALAWFCVAPIARAGAEDASPAQKVPVIDGAAGVCSLELTVTAEGKPAYAAIVKVHIAYGFGGFHKLDLQASTNVDGKVKFTGLPGKVRRSAPLEFGITKDEWTGTVKYDPESKCQDIQTVALEKNGSPPAK